MCLNDVQTTRVKPRDDIRQIELSEKYILSLSLRLIRILFPCRIK